MADKKQLSSVVTAHAWDKDRQYIAFCANDTDLQICRKNDYQNAQVLSEHDQVITGIDWAPNTNRIVTCSQDRNAYVWTWNAQENLWRPTLVILRINRAATAVKWSPSETKFAVASGAKTISVCFFEEDNDWWVSKHIKKQLKSTVLCVAWHPGNIFLAAGSSDFKVRVYAAQVKGIDKKPQGPTPFKLTSTFGECLAEFDSNSAWVHGVAFNPSGTSLAYVSHDSSVTFVDTSSPDENRKIEIVKGNHLPFRSLLFIDDNKLVAAGYDCNPFVFANSGGKWSLTKRLDDANETSKSVDKSAAANARDKFKAADSRGTNDASEGTILSTKHQNCITSLYPFDKSSFTSTGVDGFLVTWKV